ncbi:hypothetical protein ACKVM7_000271 [Arthrobacter russicus]
MGKTRSERTWPKPQRTRHAWMRDGPHPNSAPRQVYIVSWRRQSYKWLALVVYAVEIAEDPEPVVIQRWVPAEKLRAVEADPNRAYDLR